ncbi:hypothetical protein ACFVRD_33070 [Streptomyces sp. NPDC057908]|uniref:hypothetical protein n=1 Tax=Streptomyces sp. NPDC057908 TaxID=3346276 RepID=UPI0036F14797
MRATSIPATPTEQVFVVGVASGDELDAAHGLPLECCLGGRRVADDAAVLKAILEPVQEGGARVKSVVIG